METEFRIALTYAGRDQILYGRLALPAGPGPHPAVVLVHGYKSFLDWGFLPTLASRLARSGIAAVRFNGSASGIDVERDPRRITDLESFARGTYSQELEDLERVRLHLTGWPGTVDPSRLGLFGYSRGGGMALVHAAERGDYRAVVVWAPLTRVLRFSEEELRRWRTDGQILVTEASTGRKLRLGPRLLEDVAQNRERLDIQAACSRLRAPTLLVAAERDRAVSPSELDDLARSFPEGAARSLHVRGVGHAFGSSRAESNRPPALQRALDATIAHFERELLAESERAR